MSNAAFKTMSHMFVGRVNVRPIGKADVFGIGIVWPLQLIEEGQELIARPETAGLAVDGCHLGQELLLQGEVGIQIYPSCLDRFVPKPEGDYRGFHTSVEQIHGHGVAQAVEGNSFLAQGRTGLARDCEVLVQEMLDRIGAQSATSGTREDQITCFPIRPVEPSFQHRSTTFAQRNCSFLPPLANDLNMSANAELDVLSREPRDFRQAHASLYRQQEQCVISLPILCGPPRRVQQSDDLLSCQEVNQPSCEAHGRCCKDAFDLSAVRWQLASDESEEGADGCQAQIASLCADTASHLQIVQERGDQRSVDLLELNAIGIDVEMCLRKAQQEPECIAIRANGVLTYLLLLHQPLREEALQESRETRMGVFHTRPRQWRSRRLVACFMSEGC